VGIDLGLTHFAVLSDGRKIASPRFLRRAERKLRKAQQDLSRKKNGGANRAKARVRIARIHAHVAADSCRDWLHKESTRIIRESQAVYVEDLCIRGLAKTPAGQVGARCRLVGALPFSWCKQAGWGREMGYEVLNYYTEVKAVTTQVARQFRQSRGTGNGPRSGVTAERGPLRQPDGPRGARSGPQRAERELRLPRMRAAAGGPGAGYWERNSARSRSSADFGLAPTISLTTSPPLKTLMVGMFMIPYCWLTLGFSSTLSFTTWISSCSLAISSRIGDTCRHGPHHSAQ
jgi:hypothetical protein